MTGGGGIPHPFSSHGKWQRGVATSRQAGQQPSTHQGRQLTPMNPVPGGLFQRKDHRVAYVHTTWLPGYADRATVKNHNGVVIVELPDGINVCAVEGDTADQLGSTLVSLGEQVLILNGTRRTEQDSLIVKAFLDGEGLGQSSAALFHRFIAYRDGVIAHPYDDDTVADLQAVIQ